MIELKITIEAALALLLDRIKVETEMRHKSNDISKFARFEDLSYKHQIKIVEAAIFDTIFLLPVDIISQRSNLSLIITETVKSLYKVFRKEEYLLYNKQQADKIINYIYNYFTSHLKNDRFKNN
ncbi:hypothetical protein [Melioribacter sp. OK-6-Me]|uniref:hypothetical protein n=1 Tax=unclassified Melioribacter TaxID=2627329 RepID=UPI003EDB4CC9